LAYADIGGISFGFEGERPFTGYFDVSEFVCFVR
jgi:hypothetical protein